MLEKPVTRDMALEKSGKLKATNLLLYIILTQCNVDIAMLHIDETPVKLVYKNNSANI